MNNDHPPDPAAGSPVTLMVHGTMNVAAQWYRPGGALHEHVREEFRNHRVIPVTWSGGRKTADFQAGAQKLISIVEGLGDVSEIQAICHSNGANVVNYATRPGVLSAHPGLNLRTIVYLSPNAYRESLPDLDRIVSQRVFVFRPKYLDAVLDPLGLPKSYTGTALGEMQKERFTGLVGHWSSTWVYYWRKMRLSQLVRQVWPDHGRTD